MKITGRELCKIVTAAQASGLVVASDTTDGVIKITIYYDVANKVDCVYDSYNDVVDVEHSTYKSPISLYPQGRDNSKFVEVFNDIAAHGRLVSAANERSEELVKDLNEALEAGAKQYEEYSATKVLENEHTDGECCSDPETGQDK